MHLRFLHSFPKKRLDQKNGFNCESRTGPHSKNSPQVGFEQEHAIKAKNGICAGTTANFDRMVLLVIRQNRTFGHDNLSFWCVVGKATCGDFLERSALRKLVASTTDDGAPVVETALVCLRGKH